MRVPISSTVSFALPLMVAVLAATPSLACSARAAAGDTIAGPVLEVPAASVICVALGPKPSDWVRVRLDGGASGASIDRKVLMAAAFARRVECVLDADGRGQCRLEGADVVSLAQTPTVQQAALSWR
ncbi:hypothetical protein [Caulobacter sp. UC70_42]|uniref:hypothetical protein n=1 Tax=Caulobacter sp. UC70_42 TaxID=3374551 RepID=UPI003756A147